MESPGTLTATLRPHSELFRTEKGEIVEVEWLIVKSKTWNQDVLSQDTRFRVRALSGGCVLALRASG
jgi:hypothetical protein